MAPARKEPRWLSRLIVDAIQIEQLKEHGGLHGLRDENALESALARARNKWVYGHEHDAAVLAAAYAFSLVRNHPYLDGNKRTAFLALVTFLGINGYDFLAADAEVVDAILKLAGGQLSEEELADWIRGHIRKRKSRGR